MPTLAEVRKQYPQYKDMSDDELESGLYRKFYSDMSRSEFHNTIAVKGIVGEMQGEMGMRERSDASLAPVKEMISNIPGSAYEFGHNIYQAVRHPIDTGSNIAMIGKGVMQKLGIMSGEDATPHADAVGKFLVDRYGSGEAIKKAIVADPVGVAGDVSMVLTFGGSAAARAPGIAGRLGEVASAAGRAVDPINAAVQGVRAVGEGAGAAGRAITGTQAITPERAASIDYLRGEGVTPMAGQYPTGKGLSRAERTTGSAPASGGAFERESARVAGEFTAAVNRRMGVAAERATPEVIQNVRRDLSQDFEASTRTLRVNFTPALHQNILDWAQEVMRQGLPGDATNRLTQQARNIIQGFQSGRAGRPNHMLGTTYHSMIKKGSPLDNAVHGADADVSRYAMQLRNILDDALEATASRGNATRMRPALELFREARRKWANMVIISKAVSGAGEGTAAGYVSPQRLRAVITGSGDAKLLYAAGRGDLQELARAGNEILTTTSSSGTAENILSHGVVGGLAGGAAAAMMNIPAGAAIAAAPFTPGLAGRALMSGPVQRSLRGDAPAAAPTSTARTLGGQSAFQAGRESQIQPQQPGAMGARGDVGPAGQPGATADNATPPEIQQLMLEAESPFKGSPFERAAERTRRSVQSPARANEPMPEGLPPTLAGTITSAVDPFGAMSYIVGKASPELRDKWREQYENDPTGQLFGSLISGGLVSGPLTVVGKAALTIMRAAPGTVGATIGLLSASQAGVETDRRAESFEVAMPEPDPDLVKTRDGIQGKIDTSAEKFQTDMQRLEDAFQARAGKQYPTAKARELDAKQHEKNKNDLSQEFDKRMKEMRGDLSGANEGITKRQAQIKGERQADAKAKADVEKAREERERPVVEKYPMLLALPYLGGAYSAGVTYQARRQAIEKYNNWVSQAKDQITRVDKIIIASEKKAKRGAPTPESVAREKAVLGEFVEGAPAAQQAATATGFGGAALSGGLIATELSMVPYLIDWATQEPDSKAGKEARARLTTIEGWMKTATSTLAGVTGAGIGSTWFAPKTSAFPMERARVLSHPGAGVAAPAAAPRAGVPPGIMPDAWRQRQAGQPLQ